MARRGGGAGLVLLVVVLAIVLILAARGWREAAPQVTELSGPTGPALLRAPGDPAAAAAALDSLPGLADVQGEADSHAQAVQDALQSID